MEPITSQPTNNFGFQGENKGEGYVHGKSVIIFCIVVFKIIHKNQHQYENIRYHPRSWIFILLQVYKCYQTLVR